MCFPQWPELYGTPLFQMGKNGESASEAAWGLPPRPPLPQTLSCSLNDACRSGSALMWEIAVMFSMWQIIRHANQVEAAVESLIMVRVPPQRQLAALCRLPLSPSRPTQPTTPPPPLLFLPAVHPPPPHSPAALAAPDRQMDQRLEHWDVSRVCGELGTVAGYCVLRKSESFQLKEKKKKPRVWVDTTNRVGPFMLSRHTEVLTACWIVCVCVF